MKTPTANSTRIALCEARGPLNDLLYKLSGEEGGKWLHALKQMLREENPWGVATQDFPIRQTVMLGTELKSSGSLRMALIKQGVKCDKHADDMLEHLSFGDYPKEVSLDLVVVSVADLGFRKSQRLQDVYARAKEFGLELCPPEVGPWLRMQYRDQLMLWEAWIIGMNPITTWCHFRGVFSLYCTSNGMIALGATECDLATTICRLDSRFVFVRPKQVK